MNSWLNELGPGDKVFVRSSGRSDTRIATVERTTKTMIVVGGRRYRKRDGRSVGSGAWDWSTLTQYSTEKAAVIRGELERRQNLARIQRINWREIEPATIAQILELLEGAQ